MLKIFRYLKKAYIPIACIVLLLCVQVSCELTIPTYTSNIVNVGIQQGGIEDAVPDAVREAVSYTHLDVYKRQDRSTAERTPVRSFPAVQWNRTPPLLRH